jgi:predicted S18 family serine protease
MSLAQQYPCGDSIDIATLKDTADTFIEDANLIVIYASELVGSSELVSGASDKLALAQEEYVAGDYAAALYNAIDARTRAALAIELIGTTTVSEERMDVARSQAAAAINAQVSSGVQPLLSMSYYEFATVFAEEGNTVQATLYYQQAAGLAGAFLYLGADSLSSAPVEQGSSAEQPCGIRASVPIAFGIAGMAIGWVGAAVMGRRKRSRPKDD